MSFLNFIFGPPRTPVVIDFGYSFAKEEQIWRDVVDRGSLKKATAKELNRYLKDQKRAPAKLIVIKDKSTYKYYLDLSPAFILRIYTFSKWNLFYGNSIALPNQSRAFYEATQGNAAHIEIEDTLRFSVLDTEESLRCNCHVCSGKGRVSGNKTCYYCKGDKRTRVRIIKEGDNLKLGFPGEKKKIYPKLIFSNSQKIKRGKATALQTANDRFKGLGEAKKDHLKQGEEKFQDLLNICEKALRIEQQIEDSWPIEVQKNTAAFWRKADAIENPIKRFLCLPEKSQKKLHKEIKFFDSLIEKNSSQKEAVILACSAQYPLVTIQGPPGTGKTSVICEIIRQELLTPGKILVISQSNLAVDNVLEKIFKKTPILRIGKENKVSENIKPFLLEEVIDKGVRFSFWDKIKSIASLLNSEKNSYREISEDIRVIGATCIGSEHPFVRKLNKKIKLVIIDEAGRSPLLESLVPIKHAPRAVLVGDHKQLPPIVTTEVRKLWQKTYLEKPVEDSVAFKSVFETMHALLPKESGVILSTQYRMHPQIGEFIKQVFYKEEGLEHGVTANERSLPIEGFPEALSYHSTIDFGGKRFEKNSSNSNSKENLAEAELISKLLDKLDNGLSEKNVSVGIIAFYQGQVELLKKTLPIKKFSKLIIDPDEDIATLDSYQGKEEDIIILSLVRCPRNTTNFDASWYKFFLDVRRLNVALSRARKRLLIVGDISQILEITKNKEQIPGFEVLERLDDYIKSNNLQIEI